MHTHTLSCTHTVMHAHTHTHTCTQTHANTHIYTNTHSHTTTRTRSRRRRLAHQMLAICKNSFTLFPNPNKTMDQLGVGQRAVVRQIVKRWRQWIYISSTPPFCPPPPPPLLSTFPSPFPHSAHTSKVWPVAISQVLGQEGVGQPAVLRQTVRDGGIIPVILEGWHCPCDTAGFRPFQHYGVASSNGILTWDDEFLLSLS